MSIEKGGSQLRPVKIGRSQSPMISQELLHIRIPDAASLTREIFHTYAADFDAMNIQGKETENRIGLGTYSRDQFKMIDGSPGGSDLARFRPEVYPESCRTRGVSG